MSYIVPMEKPKRCGFCPCFHAEHPMYCQAVKADKNKRIYAPYGEGRPDWCPLIEIPTPHGDLVDRNELLAEYDRQHKGPAGGARKIMETAQTVIEAEGRET